MYDYTRLRFAKCLLAIDVVSVLANCPLLDKPEYGFSIDEMLSSEMPEELQDRIMEMAGAVQLALWRKELKGEIVLFDPPKVWSWGEPYSEWYQIDLNRTSVLFEDVQSWLRTIKGFTCDFFFPEPSKGFTHHDQINEVIHRLDKIEKEALQKHKFTKGRQKGAICPFSTLMLNSYTRLRENKNKVTCLELWNSLQTGIDQLTGLEIQEIDNEDDERIIYWVHPKGQEKKLKFRNFQARYTDIKKKFAEREKNNQD